MATTTCPSCGAQSATSDYCDSCGAALASAAAPVADAPTLEVPATPASVKTCQNCGAVRTPDDAFCEVCGLDFATGQMPAAPAPRPAAADTGAAPSGWTAVVETDRAFFDGNEAETPGAVTFPEGVDARRVTGSAPSGWTAVVETDRAFFDGNEAETPGAVTFPEGVDARRVTLTGDEAVIGRRSEAKGFFPEIDLSSPVSDPGVSHRHAVLRRASDGGWTIVDEGSTNGTWLNDDARPLDHGVPTALHDGDHINLGSFTRITVVQDDKGKP